MEGKIIFIGGGPGDPKLLTIRGHEEIKNADIIIYAGSLVNKEILKDRKEDAQVYNSASLDLNEIMTLMKEGLASNKKVVRVHTGDPSIYGAIAEQFRELEKNGIDYEIVPGVSSIFASAAALKKELTIPEISQTVIITRPEKRTPKPLKETLSKLAETQSTMCIFLGIHMIEEVVNDLLEHYPITTPVAIVKKASWEDQMIIEGTLQNIAEKVKDASISKTAMIIVGNALNPGDFKASKLYDTDFKHEYR